MIWRNLLIKRLPNSKHNFNSFLNNQRNILFEQWVHLFSSTPMRHVGCGWYISFLFQFNQTSLLLEFDIGPPGELFQLNSQTNPVTHDYRWGHMLLKVHCDYSNWQSNCVSTLEVCSTCPALGFDLNASSELSWCHQQHTAGKPATFRRKYNTGPLSCDGNVPACSAVSVDENNLTLLHTDESESIIIDKLRLPQIGTRNLTVCCIDELPSGELLVMPKSYWIALQIWGCVFKRGLWYRHIYCYHTTDWHR